MINSKLANLVLISKEIYKQLDFGTYKSQEIKISNTITRSRSGVCEEACIHVLRNPSIPCGLESPRTSTSIQPISTKTWRMAWTGANGKSFEKASTITRLAASTSIHALTSAKTIARPLCRVLESRVSITRSLLKRTTLLRGIPSYDQMHCDVLNILMWQWTGWIRISLTRSSRPVRLKTILRCPGHQLCEKISYRGLCFSTAC